ncbi:hypothetical protein RUMTOR_01259 [[Ruminococcus] torques ATCC 27756]|uniref:Uncharacterized protein n=1 Tax=[Ruminococcus] torques ATCC 27756 TaxID=411460 RepID=A5KM03_9FIRM|nr:hypothetical protein RUMTOR_01259 [[Ruminococcus] torques ATCC 27756]
MFSSVKNMHKIRKSLILFNHKEKLRIEFFDKSSEKL